VVVARQAAQDAGRDPDALKTAMRIRCDVVTVQRALGHSSATVTLSTYAHLWPTAENRTRAGAAAMLAAVLGAADEPLTNESAA
jgi:integrase